MIRTQEYHGHALFNVSEAYRLPSHDELSITRMFVEARQRFSEGIGTKTAVDIKQLGAKKEQRFAGELRNTCHIRDHSAEVTFTVCVALDVCFSRVQRSCFAVVLSRELLEGEFT